MSDLIRREDAIAKFKKSCTSESIDKNGIKRGEIHTAMTYEGIIKIIESLPFAEKWIPVTEALPEEREWFGTKRFGTTISDEVYVTFENPKGERFCKHLSFQNGKLSRYDQSTIDAFYPEAKPIAWMPLPEPWRGE